MSYDIAFDTDSFEVTKGETLSPFLGQIDEVRISRAAVYDKEFQPASRFTSDANTLALYHFDEGQVDKLTDSSGNQHHGQIVGAKWVQTTGSPLDPDRRAAEYVLSIGGLVSVNEQVREIEAVGELPTQAFRLTSNNLMNNEQLNDSVLAQFKDCKNLTRLFLRPTVTVGKVTDAGLAHFKHCTNLVSLVIAKTQLTDAGLENFNKCKNLTTLNLHDNLRVTDAGLAHFQDCKNLSWLEIESQHFTGAGLGHFQDCANLFFVNLSKSAVTDANLIHCKDLKSLAQLHLNGTKVTDAGLVHVKECPNLVYLKP